MKWAVLGTANIANVYMEPFVKQNQDLVAISSRSQKRADEWAEEKRQEQERMGGHPSI